DAQVSRLYAVVPKLDGLLGHDYKSLTFLEPFFLDLRRDEAARLIISGDLTRVGGQWEFETAKEFLETELQPPKGNKYPPAKPEVLRLLAPQRGLTAIAKSKPKTEKITNCRLPELSNFGSPPAEPGVYPD